MVRATGNSQAGGASGGCLKLLNCPIASRVRSETRRPPPSGDQDCDNDLEDLGADFGFGRFGGDAGDLRGFSFA